MVTRTLQIPDHVDAALERGARAEGCTVDEMVSKLLGLYEARVRVADEGKEDARAGRVIDHEAMKDWIASWGDDDEKEPPACPE